MDWGQPGSQGGETVHSVRLTWLLPIVAGAVAVWAALSWPEPGRVDEARGRVATFVAQDATGNGHDGIIQGPVRMGRAGHEGRAFSFAEHGSWVMVPSSPELNAGTRDFLVSVWVKVRSDLDAGETYDVVRKGIAYTVPGEYKLELLWGGRVRCSAKDARTRLATVTSLEALPEDGGWHRIGCARTGRHWSVLVDETVTSRAVDLGAVTNTVALSIGSKYGLEDRPLGLVDDVELIIAGAGDPSIDPVAAIRALEEVPPVAWWRLDETATSTAGR